VNAVNAVPQNIYCSKSIDYYLLGEVEQMYKMIFTKDGIRTKKDEVDPLTGETLEIDLKSVSYDELKTINVEILVNSIAPNVVDGVLKSLEMKFKTYRETSKKVPEQMASPKNEVSYPPQDGIQEPPFLSSLSSIQRDKISKLIHKVQEIGDARINVEYHKQHVAIKYNKGRSRAWIVVKASGSHHIYVWIRAAPDLHDYKHLAQPCDDSSLTHGNFKIELSTVEIDDVMPLIEQSLDFRRSDDYFKVYSRLVKNL